MKEEEEDEEVKGRALEKVQRILCVADIQFLLRAYVGGYL